MPISEAEQADLEAFKLKRIELHDNAISQCRHLLRLDAEQLKTRGHKTVDGAVRFTIEQTIKAVDKELAAFITKWPDNK